MPERPSTTVSMPIRNRNGPYYNRPNSDYSNSPSSSIAMCNCSDTVGIDGSRNSPDDSNDDRRTDSSAECSEVMVLTLQLNWILMASDCHQFDRFAD